MIFVVRDAKFIIYDMVNIYYFDYIVLLLDAGLLAFLFRQFNR